MSAVTATNGELRLELFSAYEVQDLQRRRWLHRDRDCVSKGFVRHENTSFESIETSLSYSKSVFLGKILAFKEGFLGSFTGTLYEIEVEEVLFPSDQVEIPASLFVFYPVARFSVGSEFFCGYSTRAVYRKTATGRPASDDSGSGNLPQSIRPRVGGRMLIFSVVPAESGAIISPADSGLFFDGDDGLLSLPLHPQHVESLRSLPISHIADQVREALRVSVGQSMEEGNDEKAF